MAEAAMDIETESSYRTLSLATVFAASLGMLASLGLVLIGGPSLTVAHPRDTAIWSGMFFLVFGVTTTAFVVRASLPRPFAKGTGLFIVAIVLVVVSAFVVHTYSSMLALWINEGSAVPRNALVAVLSLTPPVSAVALSGLLEARGRRSRLHRALLVGGVGAGFLALAIVVMSMAAR